MRRTARLSAAGLQCGSTKPGLTVNAIDLVGTTAARTGLVLRAWLLRTHARLSDDASLYRLASPGESYSRLTDLADAPSSPSQRTGSGVGRSTALCRIVLYQHAEQRNTVLFEPIRADPTSDEDARVRGTA